MILGLYFKEGQDQSELFNFTLQFCKSKRF